MGIIITDPTTTNYGTTHNDSYLAIAQNSVELSKNTENNTEETYRITSLAQIWIDKTARDTNKKSFKYVTVNIDVNEIVKNPYELVYDYLKTLYPNYEDA